MAGPFFISARLGKSCYNRGYFDGLSQFFDFVRRESHRHFSFINSNSAFLWKVRSKAQVGRTAAIIS